MADESMVLEDLSVEELVANLQERRVAVPEEASQQELLDLLTVALEAEAESEEEQDEPAEDPTEAPQATLAQCIAQGRKTPKTNLIDPRLSKQAQAFLKAADKKAQSIMGTANRHANAVKAQAKLYANESKKTLEAAEKLLAEIKDEKARAKLQAKLDKIAKG